MGMQASLTARADEAAQGFIDFHLLSFICIEFHSFIGWLWVFIDVLGIL